MVSITGTMSPNVGTSYSGLTEKVNYTREFPGVQGEGGASSRMGNTLATIPIDFLRA